MESRGKMNCLKRRWQEDKLDRKNPFAEEAQAGLWDWWSAVQLTDSGTQVKGPGHQKRGRNDTVQMGKKSKNIDD